MTQIKNSIFRKMYKFIAIYGFSRTLAKVMGRLRLPISLVRKSCQAPDIAMIGCGQFGYATIGYYIARRFGARFRWCYDPQLEQSTSFARFYRAQNVAEHPNCWNEDLGVKIVYIASNHASHANYAIEALRAGKTVYVEKPVAVNFSELGQLDATREATGGLIYAGYNRPFSRAVQQIRAAIGGSSTGGVTLSCFVSGHVIAQDHWYRHVDEGTRILGNAGHWIDLFIHILSWRAQWPEHLRLTITPASTANPDDNFTLVVATDLDDIFSLTISSRSEPFEGVTETINFQQADVIATISDFRKMKLWKGDRCFLWSYRRKDVGHEGAILQPYAGSVYRHWDEIMRSSALTLTFDAMIRLGETRKEIAFSDLMATVSNRSNRAST
jgi:predicted dehydrogenase